MLWSIILFLLCMQCNPANSNHEFELSYFRDQSDSGEVNEIQIKKFQPLENGRYNADYTDDTIWIRVQKLPLQQITDIRYLQIGYPQLDFVNFYNANGSLINATGDNLPFLARQITNRNFILKLEPDTMAQGPIYVKIKSKGSVWIPIQIFNDDQFINSVSGDYIINGLYFGGMLFIAFYSFFLFLSLRDTTFLFYCLYLIFFAGAAFALLGYSYQYFWPEAYYMNARLFAMQTLLAYFWAISFSIRFIHLPEKHSITRKIFRGIQVAMLPIGICIFINYRLSTILSQLAVFTFVLSIFIVSIQQLRRGNRSARLFLIAWFFMLTGSLFMALAFRGIGFDMDDSSTIMQVSTILETLLLSLALGDRYHLMQREKIDARKESLARQKEITQSYSRFVPREFIKQLGKRNVTSINLGDAVAREMTVLFSDIRNFTSISEKKSPEDLFDFINSLLGIFGPIVRKHDGIIDKYIGDAIMALFPDRPENALQAGIAIQRALQAYNQENFESTADYIRIGIGINTGPLMLGTIGETERLEGTVIGDSVNLAARLQNICKLYNAGILIGEQTMLKLTNLDAFDLRIVDRVKVKGKSNIIAISEIFNADPEHIRYLKLETQALLEKAILAYLGQEFSKADQLFASILKQNPEDLVAQNYRNRIAMYSINAPPADWDGTTNTN